MVKDLPDPSKALSVTLHLAADPQLNPLERNSGFSKHKGASLNTKGLCAGNFHSPPAIAAS